MNAPPLSGSQSSGSQSSGSQNSGSQDSGHQAVHDQYATYPYPARTAADEQKRLIHGSPSFLPEITHYLYGGFSPFQKQRQRCFNVLVAGGGTGDATVMLAQTLHHLCGSQAHIWHLDLSAAGIEIVQQRLAARNLENVTCHQGRLEDLDDIADIPESFDYIDCCGVLHHLQDPLVGLQKLADKLHPDGGMGLMVYAPYGRTGVYAMQEMIHQLTPPDMIPTEKLSLGKKLLQALPQTNWLRRNPFITDHQQGGDAGLYDLLLHSRDRAYHVQEFADLIHNADLQICGWIEPCRYQPETYLPDGPLLKQVQNLPPLAQAGFCERLAGNIKKHTLYVTSKARSCPQADITAETRLVLGQYSGTDLAKSAKRSKALTIKLDGIDRSYPLTGLSLAILAQIPAIDISCPLVDNIPTKARIFEHLSQQNPDLTMDLYDKTFKQLTEALISSNLGWLHQADLP